MTLKTKFFVPLLVILVMGMANTAFAQLSCSVASTPVSRAIDTGHTEPAGDLIFNCVAGAIGTTAATVTVGYNGVMITNNTTMSGSLLPKIAITNVTGFPGGAPTVTDLTVSNVTGQIVVSVPAQPAPVDSSFTLTNVLVSLNGTGLTSLLATVSVSPGNNLLITAGQNVATVITSILPAINITTAPVALAATTTPALYLATGAPVTAARGIFSVVVTENFIDAFRDQSQLVVGATNDTNLLFTFSGLPTGSVLASCSATLSAPVPVPLFITGFGSAAFPTLTVSFPGPTNVTAIESVTLTCGTLGVPALTTTGTTLPLAPVDVTVRVTLNPNGSALSSTTPPAVISTGAGSAIPRFQLNQLPAVGLTVISVSPATTTMIIPYVTGDPAAVPVAGTFDTGIAIANTTGETVGTTAIFGPVGVGGTGGARPQSGTITMHFFPNTGTGAFSFTTASVASGATYVNNLSQILQAAGRTTAFSGYIIAVANFTNAHGMAFLYGGTAATRITSATDVLVIAPTSAFGRSASLAVFPGVEFTTK